MDNITGAFSTGEVLALSVVLVDSIGAFAGVFSTGALLASSVLLVVSIGVVADAFNTGAVSIVLALASVLFVSMDVVCAGVNCTIDGLEDTIALGTVFAKENGVAAEVVV